MIQIIGIVDGQKIKKSQQLGVIIDDKLKWSDHIYNIFTAIN